MGGASWRNTRRKTQDHAPERWRRGNVDLYTLPFHPLQSSFQALAVPQGTQASASPTWSSSRPIHLQGQQASLAPCSIHRVASGSFTSQPMPSQALSSALRTHLPVPTGALLHASVPLHMLFPASGLPCPTTPLLSLVNSGARPHTHHTQRSPFWNAFSRSVYHQLHSQPHFSVSLRPGAKACARGLPLAVKAL